MNNETNGQDPCGVKVGDSFCMTPRYMHDGRQFGPTHKFKELTRREVDYSERNQRFENCTVQIEIDANGWPHVTVWPQEGNARVLYMKPTGNATILEITPDPNPLWNKRS